MIDEKEYFDFYIGKFHVVFKKNYLYTDRENGKEHYNKVFKVSSYDDDYGIKNWINFYTGWHKVQAVYETCGYEDNRHSLRLSLGWGNLYLYFPWVNKKIGHHEGEDINNPEKKYGFYLYGEGKFFDSFWYYKNKNGHSDVKCIYMPWTYDFYRISFLTHDGWFTCLESDRRKARKRGENTFEYPYNLRDDDQRLIKKEFPFRYVTKQGEVQDTTATVFMEEREWRPKWLRWTNLFRTVRTTLNIEFKDEMGNQRGSWKGGVLGVGCEVTPEEKKNQDFETPLRRYEEEVNKIHKYCK